MRTFNAVQMVVLFALWPFLAQWINDASFIASGIVFWIMIIAYLIGFIGLIIAVRIAIDKGWE